MRRSPGILSTIIAAPFLFLVVFVAAGAVPRSTTSSPPSFHLSNDPRVVTFTRGMTFLSDVPTTIPPNGIALLGGMVALRPLTSAQSAQVSVSSDQALSTAKSLVGLPASQPLLASFTEVDTLHHGPAAKLIQDVPAWVIIFTSSSPLALPGPFIPQKSSNNASPPVQFFHDNIVIDARTGAFVRGFYTP